jgi:hypothetical protein
LVLQACDALIPAGELSIVFNCVHLPDLCTVCGEQSIVEINQFIEWMSCLGYITFDLMTTQMKEAVPEIDRKLTNIDVVIDVITGVVISFRLCFSNICFSFKTM